jgi:hypothetical protein
LPVSPWANGGLAARPKAGVHCPGSGQAAGHNIDEIISAADVTSIALIGLIWSASTIFYTLTQT